MKVAWIGMGRIGKQMALKVLEAGHSLVGHARTPEKHDDVRQAGASLTSSLAEAVRGAEIVCVNVYSEEQLREAMLDSGALAAMESGAILIIHSTVSPAAVQELAAARPDIHVLDAPFSGTDVSARNGTIALMVGGDPTALDEARPVLTCYADYIAHIGPSGTGLTLKLVNNAMFGAQLLIARDAIRIVMASGMDKDTAIETLIRSSGNSFSLQQFGRDADPEKRIASAWPFMEKDVIVAREAAAEMGIDLGMLEVATRPFLK